MMTKKPRDWVKHKCEKCKEVHQARAANGVPLCPLCFFNLKPVPKQ